MEIDTPIPSISPSNMTTHIQNALLQLHSVTSEPATVPLLASAFTQPTLTPLQTYRAAACLREGGLREVVQHLIFRGPNAVPSAARLLLVLQGLGGTWELAVDLLRQNSSEKQPTFQLRVMTILAMLGSTKAYRLAEWTPIFHKALVEKDEEARLALYIVLEKRWPGKVESVLRVHDWESQTEFAHHPSVWRELQWASYARSLCMRVDLNTACTKSDDVSSMCNGENAIWQKTLGEDCGNCANHFVRICDILLRRRGVPPNYSIPSVNPSANDIVMTPMIHSALRDMAISIAFATPFVIEGPSGCGKTTLISLLARSTSYTPTHHTDAPDVTFIQMDSAMSAADGDTFSSLIGGVVPLPHGAGFRWRPGPIGIAVQKGHWLVFENIGKGSIKSASAVPIISQLASLQAGDTLHAPGRGEPLSVGFGFRVIATRTTFDDAGDETWSPPGGWDQWRRLTMRSLAHDDELGILSSKFPDVADCVPRVVEAVSKVSAFVQKHRGPLMRSPSLRDAIRICFRLSKLRDENPESVTVENALLETIDVLVAWCPIDLFCREIVLLLSNCWSVPAAIASDLFLRHRPSMIKDKNTLRVGRASMLRVADASKSEFARLSLTGHTSRILERTLRCLQVGEHVLLSGETGSGKTSVIQELASLLGKTLIVVNLSRQSELADLVGGFRPFELSAAIPQLARKFADLFCSCMSQKKNGRFLDALHRAACSLNQHFRALRLMRGAMGAIPQATKQKSVSSRKQWDALASELSKLELSASRLGSTTESSTTNSSNAAQSSTNSNERPRKRPRSDPLSSAAVAHEDVLSESSRIEASGPQKRHVDFEFAEGVLVRAMRNGHWVLLDELNLAPPELLERLVSVVDRGQLALPNEKGELVSQASGFSLFGAMNPPTDVGKRPLPSVLRTRFTEFHVGDMVEKEDIVLVTMSRFFGVDGSRNTAAGMVPQERGIAEDVANFFIECCTLAKNGSVEDSAGKPVRFSLRTFSRMLDHASGLRQFMSDGLRGERRALYEGAIVAFATPLPQSSKYMIRKLAASWLLRPKDMKKWTNVPDIYRTMQLPHPSRECSVEIVEGFPIESSGIDGSDEARSKSVVGKNFIISPAVKKTLQDVCRALVYGAPRLPILLQGPTAAGKTSLVAYLAKLTGNKLTRINNHEHTELSEYIGGYVASPDGSLVFSEGPLVRAARDGSWILLDELNLAPPEVLEALNRLLDDNREIFIAETGEHVKAAKGFTVFATQNPPGLYGGRKELSRAFRGRFVEVQVEDLPDSDLLTILEQRSSIPQSFAKKMIAVMRDLQIRRRNTNLFAGRHGFVTARDLFRWASRQPRSKEELAVYGFFLLGERARRSSERETVRDVIIKQIGVDPGVLSDKSLYTFEENDTFPAGSECLDSSLRKLSVSRQTLFDAFESEGIVETPHMRRMIILLVHCVANSEPTLLVGTTGGGKTSSCAVVCRAMNSILLSVNCHRHTEASDILGGFRPLRTKEVDGPLFEWVDGPLVKAMRTGSTLLVDEINMAEDAVVERLNSVLELERSILLSEKGNISSTDKSIQNVESVIAHTNFRILATMNPGGDFGKKELSPALRNRFTELWIPTPSSLEEYSPLVYRRLGAPSNPDESESAAMCSFLEWSLQRNGDAAAGSEAKHIGSQISSADPRFSISLRDVSAWCDFTNEAAKTCNLHPIIAMLHGARLVFLDGLSVGSTSEGNTSLEFQVWNKLLSFVPEYLRNTADNATFMDTSEIKSSFSEEDEFCMNFGNFRIPRNNLENMNCTQGNSSYSFNAPCTVRNSARLARAMAVGARPILLEGPPGSGKSSLIAAVAASARFPFMRVNLSEYTEMSDLVGSDAPGSVAGSFVFRPGPLLSAMRQGTWLLLDELNLASQSVLEGLNSVLDHRRSLFVSALDEEVLAHDSFRIFAAQNPAVEGGGRRGLPQSFLNRFTRVQIEAPTDQDILAITCAMHPRITRSTVANMVDVLRDVKSALERKGRNFAVGSLGLRDALRWCDLVSGICDIDVSRSDEEERSISSYGRQIGTFFDVVVLQSLSHDIDRKIAEASFERIFGFHWQVFDGLPSIRAVEPSIIRIGHAILKRTPKDSLVLQGYSSGGNVLLTSRLRQLQALSYAVIAGWPVILTSNATNVSIKEGVRLIQSLSTLCGKPMITVHGGTLSDADDFIGGYSQQDMVSTMHKIVVVSEQLGFALLLASADDADCGEYSMEHILQVASLQKKLSCLLQKKLNSTETKETLVEFNMLLSSLSATLNSISISDPINHLIAELHGYYQEFLTMFNSRHRGKHTRFEWQKSAFLNAIENGGWVVIEDADACPPAVLDRLNPLLERPPVAIRDHKTVDECKAPSPVVLAEAPVNEDGSPMTIQPHPEFRMFFLFSEGGTGKGYHAISRALSDRSLRISISEKLSGRDCNAIWASDQVPKNSTMSSNSLHPSLGGQSYPKDPQSIMAEARLHLTLPGQSENDTHEIEPVENTSAKICNVNSVEHEHLEDIIPSTTVTAFALQPSFTAIERDYSCLKFWESAITRNADMAALLKSTSSSLPSSMAIICNVNLKPKKELEMGSYVLGVAAEAFLMGSQSIRDLSARVEFLRSRSGHTGSTKIQRTFEIVARNGEASCYSISNDPTDVLTGTSFPSAIVNLLPLDPLYAMDRVSLAVLGPKSENASWMPFQFRAKTFRFQLLTLERLRNTWNKVSMLQESSISQRDSIFSKAKLYQDIGPGVMNLEVTGLSQYELITFAVVSSVVDALPDFLGSLRSTGDWEIAEEPAWFFFFRYTAELCEMLGEKTGSYAAEIVAALGELIRLGRVLASSSHTTSIRSTLLLLNSADEILKPLLRNSSSTINFAMPRTEEGQAIEKRLSTAASQRKSNDMSFLMIDRLAKALVSMSSASVEQSSRVCELLLQIATVIESNCSPSQSAMMPHWCILTKTETVYLLAYIALICSHDNESQEVTGSQQSCVREVVSKALLATKCIPDFGLNTIVALQHMLWYLDSDRDKNQATDRIVSNLVRKQLLSRALAEESYMTLPWSGQPGNSHNDVPLGISSTVLSLAERGSSQFWDLLDAQEDSVVAATVFVAGTTTLIQTYLTQFHLLKESLISTLQDVAILPGKEILRLRTDMGVLQTLKSSTEMMLKECNESKTEVLRLLRHQLEALSHYEKVAAYVSSDGLYCPDTLVDLYTIGTAWISVSSLRLLLQLTHSKNRLNIDPSDVAGATASLLRQSALLARSTVAAYITLGSVRIGGENTQSSVPVKRGIHSEKESLSTAQVAENRVVHRPVGLSSFKSFELSISGISSSILSKLDKSELICRLHTTDVNTRSFEQAVHEAVELQRSCRSTAEVYELGGPMAHFRDMTTDVILGLRELEHGLSYCLRAAQRRVNISEEQKARKISFYRELSLFPRSAFRRAPQITKILQHCRSITADGKTLVEVARYILAAEMRGSSFYATQASNALTSIVKIWKDVTLAEEEALFRKNSLHMIRDEASREATPGHDVLQALELDEEKDFTETFNPLDESIDDALLGIDEGVGAPEVRKSPGVCSVNKSSRQFKPDPGAFWILHNDVFSTAPEGTCRRLDESEYRSSIINGFLTNLFSMFSDVSVETDEIPNVWEVFASVQIAQSFERSTASLLGPVDYNFYRDPNIPEVLEASRKLQTLLQAISRIQKDFFGDTGDHPVLAEVSLAVSRLAKSCYASTSLSNLVVGIENVLRKADEWRKHFATSATRMDEEVGNVARIATRWRQLEMSSWPHLLERRISAQEDRANKWFFFLYDAIIREAISEPILSDEANQNVVNTIDQFLRSAPCGEFKRRLEMINSLSSHLLSLKIGQQESHPLGLALRGLVRFYSQLLPGVLTKISEGKRLVEKELEDFRRLVSWKPDEDLGSAKKMFKGRDKHLEYYRLKAASERTRRKLHKLCLQMDSVVRVPVYGHLSNEMSRIGFDTLISEDASEEKMNRTTKNQCNSVSSKLASSLSTFADGFPVLLETADLESRVLTGRRSSNIESLTRSMMKYGRSIEDNTEGLCDLASACSKELRRAIRSRSIHLRESKDIGIQPKKRAFVELLKGLQEIGLSPFEGTVSSHHLEPYVWLSSPDPSSLNAYNDLVNNLFYSSARQIRRLRELSDSRTRNGDITSSEAEKVRAFCSHLFEFTCGQRQSLQQLCEDVEEISDHVAVLSNLDITSLKVDEKSTWSRNKFEILHDTLQRISKLQIDLDITLSTLLSLSKMSDRSVGVSSENNTSQLLRKRYFTESKESLMTQITILEYSINAIRALMSSAEVAHLPNLSEINIIIFDGRCLSACALVRDRLRVLGDEIQIQMKAASRLSKTSLASKVLNPIAVLIHETLSDLSSSMRDTKTPIIESRPFNPCAPNLEMSSEQVIERALIACQNLTEWNDIAVEKQKQSNTPSSPGPENESDTAVLHPNILREANAKINRLRATANTHELLSDLRNNHRLVNCLITEQGNSEPPSEQLRSAVQLQKYIGTFLRVFVNKVLVPTVMKAYEFHGQSVALLRTLSSVFAGICSEGFCRPVDAEPKNNAEGTEIQDGTGFGDVGDGDISGAQDVSEQIEDEEQLLGLRDGEQQDAPENQQERAPDSGMEMTNDFEGVLQDMDRMEDDDEDNEDNDESGPEEKMSGDPGNGKNVVDERMWDEGSNEAEEEEQLGKEEKEKESASNGKSSEEDLVAKHDEEDDVEEQNAKDGQRHKGDNPQSGSEEENKDTKGLDQEENNDSQVDQRSKAKSRMDEDMNDEENDYSGEADQRNPKSDETHDESCNLPPNTNENEEDASANAEDTGSQGDAETNSRDDNVDDGKPEDADNNEPMTGNPNEAGVQESGEVDEGEKMEEDDEEIPDDLNLDGMPGEDITEPAGDDMEEDEPNFEGSGPQDELSNEADPTNQPQSKDEDNNIDDPNLEQIEPGAKERSEKDAADPLPDLSLEPQVGTATTDHQSTNHAPNQSTFQIQKANDMNAATRETNQEQGLENQPEPGSEGDNHGPQKGATGNDGEMLERTEGKMEQEIGYNDESLDPNPHRASNTEDLINKWSRSLDLLRREDGKREDRQAEDTSVLNNGVWEFKNEGEEEDNDMQALGAATADQHKPLPVSAAEEEPAEEEIKKHKREGKDAEAGHSGGDSNMQKVESVAEVPETHPDESTAVPEMEVEGDEKEVKPHPARLAIEHIKASERTEAVVEDVPIDEPESSPMETDRPVSNDEVHAKQWLEKRKNWSVEELDKEEAKELWQQLDAIVSSGASTLCEQLRLVLEPTIASGLAGGYRTGKRLNMRKVIEFVASDFRKDRIWLRRVRPDKRSYDVLIAIDNSESMSESGAGPMAIESLALVTSALSKLEIGRLGIASFGAETKLVRNFDEPLPLSSQKGAELLAQFCFTQTETDVSGLLSFIEMNMGETFNTGETEQIKLALVVSDGRLSGREEIRKQLRRLKESNILVAFIIVDKLKGKEASIYDVRRVEYDDNGKVRVLPYMHQFPIDFYAVVQDVQQLPTVLADSLRQWVEMTSAQL